MNTRELNELIIGCSYRIYNKMGYGFLEDVYRNCLLLELQKMNLQAEGQYPLKAYYEGQLVGEFVADVLVENKILIQVKSLDRVVQLHEQQLINCLAATQVETGLIINFGENKMDVIQKHRELSGQASLFVESFLSPVNA